MSIESVMPSNHLILCCSLLLVPSVFPRIRVFSSESALHIRWPKYWSFSFSIILLMNTQGWLPLGLTGLISLLSFGSTNNLGSADNRKSHCLGLPQRPLWVPPPNTEQRHTSGCEKKRSCDCRLNPSMEPGQMGQRLCVRS